MPAFKARDIVAVLFHNIWGIAWSPRQVCKRQARDVADWVTNKQCDCVITDEALQELEPSMAAQVHELDAGVLLHQMGNSWLSYLETSFVIRDKDQPPLQNWSKKREHLLIIRAIDLEWLLLSIISTSPISDYPITVNDCNFLLAVVLNWNSLELEIKPSLVFWKCLLAGFELTHYGSPSKCSGQTAMRDQAL